MTTRKITNLLTVHNNKFILILVDPDKATENKTRLWLHKQAKEIVTYREICKSPDTYGHRFYAFEFLPGNHKVSQELRNRVKQDKLVVDRLKERIAIVAPDADGSNLRFDIGYAAIEENLGIPASPYAVPEW